MALPFYHIATPSQALLVSGRKNKDGGAAVYLNRGKFVNPMTATFTWRSLEGDTVIVEETCPTMEYVNFVFTAAVTYAVKPDAANIRMATTLYPDNKVNPDTGMTRLQEFTHQTLTAHLRSVVGGIEIKTILANRDDLRKKVQEQCESELQGVGLEVKSFRIQHIGDAPGSTYLQDLSAKSRSDIRASAEIAQAQATQKAVEQQQLAEQKQAGFLRDTAINAAKLKAETDKENAVAAQSGPLQDAESQQAVIDKQRELAAKQGDLIKAQLEADEINRSRAKATQIEIEANANKRQAEIAAEAAANAAVFTAQGAADVAERQAVGAESQAKAVVAEGDAEARKIRAIGEATAAADRAKNEAAAAEGKVSIEQLAIQTMPAIVQAAASSLQGGEKVFINGGTQGGVDLVSQLVGLGPLLIRQFREALAQPVQANGEQAVNGQAEQVEAHF